MRPSPNSGPSLRETVFLQKLGDAYVADAFRLAREAITFWGFTDAHTWIG